MTDSSKEHAEKFQKFLKEQIAEKENKQKIALRFMVKLMKQHDLKFYAAEYSGEGDSGAINFTCLSNESLGEINNYDVMGDNFNSTPDEILQKIKDITLVSTDFPEPIQPFGFSRRAEVLEFTLMDALEHCAYYFLPSGFEINDGGQGVLTLNAENGEVEIEAGSNYTEVSYSSISHNLGE